MISRDELNARAKRLNPYQGVNRYTNTLNDPMQEAQSAYAGPEWAQYFGSLQKTQEDAQNAGMRYGIDFSGFGNTTSTQESGMPSRRRVTLGSDLSDADRDTLREVAGQQNFDANVLQTRYDQLGLEHAQRQAQAEKDAIQQADIERQKQDYQRYVLDSIGQPAMDTPMTTVATGAHGEPSYTMRPDPTAPPQTARERMIARTPGSMRPTVDAALAPLDLADRKQALAEKAQQEASDLARDVSGFGDGAPEEFTADPPDPKTANIVMPRTGLTPSALHQNAQIYGLEGKMPSMGMGGKGPVTAARMAIQNKAGAIASAAGVDLPTVQQEYKNNQQVLGNLMPKYKILSASAETANKNLQLALDQSAKVPRTGSPLVNRYSQYLLGHTLTGDPELTKLENYVYAAAREYAKVTGGSFMSAAELSNAGAKKAEELLNAAQTQEQFPAAVGAMQNDMNNVADPWLKQISQVSPNVARFLATARGQAAPTTTELAPGAAPPAAGRGGAPRVNPFRPKQ